MVEQETTILKPTAQVGEFKKNSITHFSTILSSFRIDFLPIAILHKKEST